ncbi:MAG: IS30 family transposase [Kurthia sp.]|nr:IS30 family transposase [Candidatus Kurthia equi]
MSHLTEENRKTIASGIAHNKTLRELANEIGCDPTTISKEVKKNRIISKEAKGTGKKFLCKKLEKWPFVCVDCTHKYRDCLLTQLKYVAQIAQKKYEYRLHETRKGLNLTKEEHELINVSLKTGKAEKKSIYNIVHEAKLPVSVSTIYRYIEEKKVDFTKMDLPYAVTYKKRKSQNKKYEYPNNKIDRSNRTYIDYLSYKKHRINEMTVQMDFLGSIKTDSKSILTLIIPELHFVFLFTIENKNAKRVVDTFNWIQNLIGIDSFKEIFPSILTDRDPSFSDIEGIEFDPETGELRTKLFFCDAFRSNQKASVENMNKQIRKFFPKGKSVDNFTQSQINLIAKTINETPLHSLDGATPREAFSLIFGEETYIKIFGE